jgi:hypothetical protein
MDNIEAAMADIQILLKEKYPSLYKIMNRKISRSEVRTFLNMMQALVEGS